MSERGFDDSASRTARWANVVQQMKLDCESDDVLVYGSGAGSLAQALGGAVRSAEPIGPTAPADIVLCDGPLHAVPMDSVDSALAEIASLTSMSALVVFPVEGDGEPKAYAPARMPLASWRERLGAYFEVLHAQAVGEGEGLALVVPRPGQRAAQAITNVLATEQPAPAGPAAGQPASAQPVESTPGGGAPGIATRPLAGGGPAATAGATGPRVFVGTEPRMRIAETVLNFSIEHGASKPVAIESMDYSRGGIWAGWDMGRPAGRPATVAQNAQGHAVWFTDFTNFRWAIPEACGFTGRAIYLDVDILVLGDIDELFNLPMPAPVLTLNPGETSVMLFDCAAFRDMPGWPRIDAMKSCGWGIRQYLELLQRQGAFGTLPERWNCLDGRGFVEGETRLVHYTAMDTQPWRPYPDRLFYRPHPVPALEQLWFHFAKAAREAGRFEDPAATIQPVTTAAAGPAFSTRPSAG